MNELNPQLNIQKRILLDLTANGLFDLDKNIDFENADIKSVWFEAYMQTVPLIAFSKIDNEVFEKYNLPHIKESLKKSFSKNTRIDFEHVRIHSVMTAAGIPYTIIKGLASALYYNDPLMRAMGDVDFLVKPCDIERADKVLRDNGFVLVKDIHDCHMVYEFGGCRFEMHFEPAGIPHGRAEKTIREYLEDAVDCAVEAKTELGIINVPSVFHHGLIILLHMCHHLTGEGIGLRHICDWATFISSISKEDFANIFEEKLKKIGLWRFACILTQICVEYLSCPSEISTDKIDDELIFSLLNDIFKGGNFGQKSQDRSHEQLILSSKNEESIEKNSMLKQLFKSANSIVYSKWKITEKIKILLPLGWIFFGGRYLIRSILGRRPKIRPKKIAQEATERKSIYSQLCLFECDE